MDLLPMMWYANPSKHDNERLIECAFYCVKGVWQMRYLSVAETAKIWNVSERSVRNYCAHGRVPGAFLAGKIWNIPENAQKPERSNKKKEKPMTLLDIFQDEKANKYSGGIYHKTQIDLTYNSNHMEGSRLTYDQTRYIIRDEYHWYRKRSAQCR